MHTFKNSISSKEVDSVEDLILVVESSTLGAVSLRVVAITAISLNHYSGAVGKAGEGHRGKQ